MADGNGVAQHPARGSITAAQRTTTLLSGSGKPTALISIAMLHQIADESRYPTRVQEPDL